MAMAQCSLCLGFAALMASLGFCSLPKAVPRGFAARGCLSVGTLSSWREEATQEALAVAVGSGHGVPVHP